MCADATCWSRGWVVWPLAESCVPCRAVSCRAVPCRVGLSALLVCWWASLGWRRRRVVLAVLHKRTNERACRRGRYAAGRARSLIRTLTHARMHARTRARRAGAFSNSSEGGGGGGARNSPPRWNPSTASPVVTRQERHDDFGASVARQRDVHTNYHAAGEWARSHRSVLSVCVCLHVVWMYVEVVVFCRVM